MHVSHELTIAIVTKNRLSKLARCLKSIGRQTIMPKEIIIVDNDINKSAHIVAQNLSKILPIRYISEKRWGVPFARNNALFASKTKYIGFVDDDCILDEGWVENAIGIFKKNKDVAYICGKTNLFNRKNIFAVAQYTYDQYWYAKKIKINNRTSPGNFDTKNVIIDRIAILAKGLKFDTRCKIGAFDSADFDFGLQLDNKGVNGIYSNKVRLAHEETDNFSRYVRRAYYRGKIAKYISKKWKLDDKHTNLAKACMPVWILLKTVRFPIYLVKYTSSLKFPIYFKILVTICIIIYEASYMKGYLDPKT
jgi:glycosyltransferase involved in cell wall biosynthesis